MMPIMRAGVVADNHRLIDPSLPALLADVDEIWHAGDAVTLDILDILRRIAPVRFVRGNNDQGSIFASTPEEELFERKGVRILLRHIVGSPPRLDRGARTAIGQLHPAIVVMGHSHRPMAEGAGGVLYLNPGSCGPRRFSLPRSAAVLDLSGRDVRFVVTDLDTRKAILDRTFVLPVAAHH